MTTNETHTLHQLDPGVKTLWSIRFLILALLLTAMVFAVEVYTSGTPVLPLPLGAASALIFILGLTAAFVIPMLRYRVWGFGVRNNELHVRRGILTRVYTIAPTGRIQHLDVAQSLTERMLGLGRLVVYTAGTRDADIVIPGLQIAYAQDLVSAGRKKALIVVGHVASEQWGMQFCAEWLKGFVTEVPVTFLPLIEPYWNLRRPAFEIDTRL